MIENISIRHCITEAADRLEKDKQFKNTDGKVVDRTKQMNASEAMSCIRKQWFSKNGFDAGVQDWGYARRGTHMEKYFVSMMEDHIANSDVAMSLSYVGDQQISLLCKETKISATPDGVLNIIMGKTEENLALEFKSIDPRTNKTKLPKENHVTQLKISMALLNQEIAGGMMDTVVPIKRGLLIYMDASNYNDIVQFEITCDDQILNKLAPRASKVLRTSNVENLDREGKSNGRECKQCPYTEPCGVAIAAPVVGRANRNSNLDEAVNRYLGLKQQEDILKEDKAHTSEEIKQELVARNVSELVVGSARVALKIVNGRRSLNRKLVEQAGLDLSQFETLGAPSERLEVKLV